MFLPDCFYSVLASLGRRQKMAKILFLGPDVAGMTDLLNMLRGERLMQHQPMEHQPMQDLTSAELSIGNIKFKAFSLGDLQTARRVCEYYYVKMDAVVYIINVCDLEQILASGKEVTYLFFSESFANVPVLVLCNHVSGRLGYVTSGNDLHRCLGLFCHRAGKRVFMCSIDRNRGYERGFKWLFKYIQ